jgi:hypothetical protein
MIAKGSRRRVQFTMLLLLYLSTNWIRPGRVGPWHLCVLQVPHEILIFSRAERRGLDEL